MDEIGTCRKWGGLPSTKEILEASDEELLNLPPPTYLAAKKIRKEHDEEERSKHRDKTPPIVEWHYGPTGTGKTEAAFDAGAVNVIYHNEYFSDWGDARVISIEEMRGQIPYDTLLKLTDRYHNYYRVNIKYGSKLVDLDRIIITSPKRPEECYPHQTENDSINQLLRRITKIVEHTQRDEALENL